MRNLSSRGQRRIGDAGRALAAAVAAMLAACAVVDNFAATAVGYNLQAEEIRNQTILLNIVRAAYRKPMQFSDFTTVTGLATASVTAGVSVPFLTIPGSVAKEFLATTAGTMSGGPNFTVSILNTKEFYSGILQPISLQTVTLYLGQGFPREMLLTLLLSEIQYKKNGQVIHGYNGVDPAAGPDGHRTDFRMLLRQLIDRGLDAEEIDQATPVGPPLAEQDVSSLGTLAGLPQDQTLVKYDGSKIDTDLSAAERGELAAKRIKTYFRLEKRSTSYRFCFESSRACVGSPIADTGLVMNPALVCGAAADVRALAPSPVQPAKGAPQQIHTLMFGAFGPRPSAAKSPAAVSARAAATPAAPSPGCPPPEAAAPDAAPSIAAGQELNMTARSVEQLIYYLGEIARGQLGWNGPPKPCPLVATGSGAACMFRLRAGPGLPGAISAAYDGASYAIAVDPTGRDRSSQVLGLVSQLLALNNSAKDLPAPSIIPVIH